MPNKKKLSAKPKSAGKTSPPDSTRLEGRKAPDFELADDAGNTLNLSNLIKGKNLVLYFYPKDLTPGCTIEACSFRDNLDVIRVTGAQVAGISGDTTALHERFRTKYDLNFPLLSDVGNQVARKYGVFKKKSLYGREFMGIERTTFLIGKDGIVHKVFPKVKVSGHTQEVLAALKEMH